MGSLSASRFAFNLSSALGGNTSAPARRRGGRTGCRAALACGLVAGVVGFASIGCTAGTNGQGGGGAGSGSNSASTNSFSNSASTGGTFSSGTMMSSGQGGGCAGTSIMAQKAQLDLFIMLDQSGSMGDTTSSGATKWKAVTDALKSFVQLPEANGLGVGIQYFGLPGSMSCPMFCSSSADCGVCGPCMLVGPGQGICTNYSEDSCNPGDYSMPEVEIAPLPGVSSAIISSINGHSPSTGTPTHPALQGAIVHGKQWANAHPGHVTVVVLATDGIPSGCDADIDHIASVADVGFTVNPSIRTFVIGVGDALTDLNAIAAAGGTNQAFIVDTTQDTTAQFLQALQTIQGIVLPCSYGIPVPATGEPDFNSVNVNYTPGGGSKKVIPYVKDASQCPTSGDAWYYDDAANPTQILLCPSTCNAVSGDTSGKVDIVLGCATIPA